MARRKATFPHPQTIVRDRFSHYTADGRPKKIFLSEDSAESARIETGMGSVYRCIQCGFWHLGKRP